MLAQSSSLIDRPAGHLVLENVHSQLENFLKVVQLLNRG